MDRVLNDVFKTVGGVRALARLMALSPAAVSKWDRVPPRHVLTIERLTGIPREKLRPDYYPPGDRGPAS